MGSHVIAECECGLRSESLIGGGMLDFLTTCYFPCLCERCNRVVQVNLLAKRPRCPKCRASRPIPYSDERLRGTAGDELVAQWRLDLG